MENYPRVCSIYSTDELTFSRHSWPLALGSHLTACWVPLGKLTMHHILLLLCRCCCCRLICCLTGKSSAQLRFKTIAFGIGFRLVCTKAVFKIKIKAKARATGCNIFSYSSAHQIQLGSRISFQSRKLLFQFLFWFSFLFDLFVNFERWALRSYLNKFALLEFCTHFY